MNNLETTLEHAQKITLGQLDNGTLATAVTCAETLQIVRHGLVESYVIPKHLIDDLLLKMAVLECDNKRLLGDRVAESIEVPKSHFFNHDFKIDMDALKTDDLPTAMFRAQCQQAFKSKRDRESIQLKAKRVEDFKTWVRETTGDYESIELPKTRVLDFKIDMDAVTSCDMPHVFETAQEMEISRRIRKLEQEPKADLDLLFDLCRSFKPEKTPSCRYCLDPNCQRDDHCLFDRYWLTPL